MLMLNEIETVSTLPRRIVSYKYWLMEKQTP